MLPFSNSTFTYVPFVLYSMLTFSAHRDTSYTHDMLARDSATQPGVDLFWTLNQKQASHSLTCYILFHATILQSPLDHSSLPPQQAYTLAHTMGQDCNVPPPPSMLTGLPAVSLPAGQSKEGLPLGLQLAAWQFQERKLLSVASALQNMLD